MHIIAAVLFALSFLGAAGSIHAQEPTTAPPAPLTPPEPPAPPAPPAPPTTAASTTVTADALLGFLQREANSGGGACALSTTYRVGDRLAVACGASGVWIAQIHPDGSLSMIARQSLGAPVVRLFDGGGRLWAELDNGAALPIDPSTASTTSTLAPPTTFISPTPAPTTLAPTPSPTVRLVDGEVPPLSDGPRPWSRVFAGARDRAENIWEVSGTFRPFLALSTLGGGAVIDAEVGYRFALPIHVWAAVSPLALGTGKDHGGTSPFVALALASLDTRGFELGLGLGAQSVNSTFEDVDVNKDPVHPGSGIAVSQFGRLGNRDGLMFSFRSDFVLFHSAFGFSNLFVNGQLPLRTEQPLWIIAKGGGGTSGYAIGEIGLRTRLRGDDTLGAGTVFLTVTIGGTSLFKSPVCVDSTRARSHCSFNYSGPSMGFGTEWRM